MNTVIDAARNHYRQQLTGALQKMHVEEWGIDLYYTNKISYKDQARLIDLHASGNTSEALLESLIVKARREDGSPAFTHADRPYFLNEVDPDVILKIVSQMNRSTKPVEDTLKKN